MITSIPPFSGPLLGFSIFFYSSYFLNRLMLYLFNTTRPRTDLDLQAGADMFIYMVPTYLQAIWRVYTAETKLGRWLKWALTCGGAGGAIGFTVTKKGDDGGSRWDGFSYTLPFAAFYLLVLISAASSATDLVATLGWHARLEWAAFDEYEYVACLLYTSPSPRDS